MKNALKLFALCAASLTVVGCNKEATKREVIIFAAASMTESLNAIKGKFESLDPSMELLINYGGSGKLRDQINQGAKCDIFISAGQSQMNGVSAHIQEGTRKDILENQVALVVKEGVEINTFDDLKTTLEAILADSGESSFRLGIAQPSVPVRDYSDQILNSLLGVTDAASQLIAKGVVVEGADVKAVTTSFSQGATDVALIYKSDAYSAGLSYKALAGEDLCSRCIYPSAILSRASDKEATDLVYTYITESSYAKSQFELVGFKAL